MKIVISPSNSKTITMTKNKLNKIKGLPARPAQKGCAPAKHKGQSND